MGLKDAAGSNRLSALGYMNMLRPHIRQMPQHPCKVLLALALPLVLAAALVSPARAVDVPHRNPPAEERAVRQAREAIAEQAWRRAIELLQTHTIAYPDDADAHNLLGYSLRQIESYELSLAAYERALAINPEHLGAHEYLGQLMLTLGRRERAMHHLRALERLCQASCEGYQQLKRSLESAAPARARGYGR